MFAIRDGIAVINEEPIPEAEVDCSGPDPTDRFPWGHRRIRIPCDNGYTLSIIYSSGTYSDNHEHGITGGVWHENVARAELGVLITKTSLLLDVFEWGDTVKGYSTPEEAVKTLVLLRMLPEVDPSAYPTPREQRIDVYEKLRETFALFDDSNPYTATVIESLDQAIESFENE